MRIALSLLLIALPLAAANKPTVAHLQTQVKHLTEERDDLKQRLAATEGLRQEAEGAKKARDLARSEADAARKDADQLRASLKENQGGSDAILKELQAAKQGASSRPTSIALLRVIMRLLSAGARHQRFTVTYPLAGDAMPFTQISTGENHTCGVRTDGTLACWGAGTTYTGNDPEFGQSMPPAGTFIQVSAGVYHTCGIKSDSTMIC